MKPSHIRELEGNLSRHFDAEVDIKERGGKGSLTIRFHSKGHFQRLDQLLKAFESASSPFRGYRKPRPAATCGPDAR